ncbi:tyrosine-type recombinase/integrase [Streptomyces sp. NPDC052043]|uniref:tyrosine-type recombinase/integrase n=1 Tax=Streptomyces sp. NPDC052043 TaxID=3365684 RepID=UPI0037D8BC76
MDCLDAYLDGYPRLRIPVGKTYTERMVPLHPQAADALRDLIDAAKAANAAARHDAWAQRPVRYVFMRRGKPMGRHFLFEDALEIACRKAGLVDGDGNLTVTAHRFRHTVGTQLADGGAQIQTIMAVLGHRNAQMSATYSHISGPVLKEQYEKVIAAGGRIAGPAAEELLNRRIGEGEADESALTGESLPVTKNPGDDVYSGSAVSRGGPVVRMWARERNEPWRRERCRRSSASHRPGHVRWSGVSTATR